LVSSEVGYQGSNDDNQGNDLDTRAHSCDTAGMGRLPVLWWLWHRHTWWWDVYIEPKNFVAVLSRFGA
jgi:hypothetical protein